MSNPVCCECGCGLNTVEWLDNIYRCDQCERDWSGRLEAWRRERKGTEPSAPDLSPPTIEPRRIN